MIVITIISFEMQDVLTYELNNHLPMDTLIQMMRVNQSHRQEALAVFHQRGCDAIIKRLKTIFGQHYDQFETLFQQCGAILSGSFVLQCLLGEEWPSDVDIYIPILGNDLSNPDYNHPKSSLENFIYQTQGFYVYHEDIKTYDFDNETKMIFLRQYVWLSATDNDDNHNNTLKKFIDDHDTSRTHYKYEKFDAVDNNRKALRQCVQNQHKTLTVDTGQEKVVLNTTHLQCILVDCHKNEMINFIKDEYDFDICKNVFWLDDQHQLYIHALYDIINKQTTFKYTTKIETSEKRKEKYEQRGFTFTQ